MVNGKKKIISVKLFYFLALLLFSSHVALFSACKSKENYIKEIERRGITYSEESFLTEIVVGNREIIDSFIKAGININARNINGETALMVALLNGNLTVANILIERGSDIHAQDKEGYTALMIASFNG